MSALLHFHGAAGCVTGSCALLETKESRILVDCGLFQGSKTLKSLNYEKFPFDPRSIDAVLLTHAHIDHSGLLPKLMIGGFKGPIFATAGTRDLCAVMLPDAGAIQEMEVESLNRRNERRGGERVEPIFTVKDAREVMSQFRVVRLGDMVEVAEDVSARWWHAGHILGAASIEVECAEGGKAAMRLLFSGDLGPGGRDLMDDPQGPSGVDHLILESTYGDVERASVSSEERRSILAAEMSRAYQTGGPLLIPAFAVERTQELIVDLLDLMEGNKAPPGPIFLDSPLAIRASDVFFRHGQADGADNPYRSLRESRLLRFTESVAESREIERMKGWHVIIAASGMCDAGRIRHHLKRLLWKADATVLIVGYQAVGTLGRFLLEGRREVRIQGEVIKVRAAVREIDVYSGHADAGGLVNWAKARGPVSGKVFLVHGEPPNQRGLSKRLAAAGFDADNVITAKLDESYRLRPGGADAGALSEPRIAREAVAQPDWHNARAGFLSALNARLSAAKDDGERQRILDALEAALGN
ncbi:MAG: metallo-beta-lactamase family protein [Caulobacteraceae bacterium]|nr:MAG: metallo-beta-lactamase family protein [Caulobacteraceae bacterium]